MRQIFSPGSNAFAKGSVIGIVLLVVVLLGGSYVLIRSPWWTGQHVTINQPVMFSHQHHVGGLGIQCQYCHTSVTKAAYAGMPPTHTCMTCHSQLYTDQPALEPVRRSYATGQPIHWERVNNVADFVYFNHSIHVQKGVGCATCHGQIDQMPLTYKAESLSMGWCLNCHNAPEKYLRPREEVFNMEYQPPADQIALGQRLLQEYHIDKTRLSNCYVCHR